jgi:hypothetical protein
MLVLLLFLAPAPGMWQLSGVLLLLVVLVL